MRRIDREEAMALLAREAEALPAHFKGCAMCGMAAGHPSDLEVLAERPEAIAVLDRLGNRRGHLLVILRRHVESIAELPWSEYAAVQRLCWEAARALERVLKPKRVFVAALGSARQLTMSFPHHHVHVVPLFDGGEGDRPSEVLTWRHGVWLYAPEEARELGAALRGAWGEEREGAAWALWRQDDTGNRFLMSRGHTREEADRLCDALEAKGHKQLYWVALDEKGTG